MKNFLLGSGVIFSLEIRQRIRGVAWWVLLGVFFVILLIVTVLLTVAFSLYSGSAGREAGGPVYSTIIYFVLLLGTLVAPAMSGNAINGDREAGTLATTQVTLVSTGQIIFGKFLAAWVTALGFLVVSVPFLVFSVAAGGLSPVTLVVSLLTLAVELGVFAAIGVGLSGLILRPLFSVMVTYLVVAALSFGTLIAFGLGGLVVQSPTVTHQFSQTRSGEYVDDTTPCTYENSYRGNAPRFDYVWGFLVANPYVVLADAIPTTYTSEGQPSDLFGQVKFGERSAQIPPKLVLTYSDCDNSGSADPAGSPRHVIDSTTPGWLVGILAQFVLVAAAFWGAHRKLRTPAGRLSRESRIA